MGNTGLKLEPDAYIRYCYSGFPEDIELLFFNLKGSHRFSKKIPSLPVLTQEFNIFMSKITTSDKTRNHLNNLPKKYKWRLLCKNEDIISGRFRLHGGRKSKLENLLNLLVEEPSVYSFKRFLDQMYREREDNEEVFWKDFKNYRGP